jgi:hypothetical protein
MPAGIQLSLRRAARLLVLVAAGCVCASLPSGVWAQSPPAASFAWTIKPPPGELSLCKDSAVDIGIAVQGVPATDVLVVHTALIEQSTKVPLPGNSLCRTLCRHSPPAREHTGVGCRAARLSVHRLRGHRSLHRSQLGYELRFRPGPGRDPSRVRDRAGSLLADITDAFRQAPAPACPCSSPGTASAPRLLHCARRRRGRTSGRACRESTPLACRAPEHPVLRVHTTRSSVSALIGWCMARTSFPPCRPPRSASCMWAAPQMRTRRQIRPWPAQPGFVRRTPVRGYSARRLTRRAPGYCFRKPARRTAAGFTRPSFSSVAAGDRRSFA